MIKQQTIIFLIFLTLSCPDEKYCRICKSLNKDPYCSECENSYLDIKNSKCTTDIQQIKNCRVYSFSEKLICKTCKLGFGIKGDNCRKCKINNCAFCNENINECQGCYSGLKGDKFNCETGFACKNEDCKVCGIDDQCLICKKGFSLFERECRVNLEDNCFEMNENGDCLACAYGFYMTDKGGCVDNDNWHTSMFAKVMFGIVFFMFLSIVTYIVFIQIKKKSKIRKLEEEEYISVND